MICHTFLMQYSHLQLSFNPYIVYFNDILTIRHDNILSISIAIYKNLVLFKEKFYGSVLVEPKLAEKPSEYGTHSESGLFAPFSLADARYQCRG